MVRRSPGRRVPSGKRSRYSDRVSTTAAPIARIVSTSSFDRCRYCCSATDSSSSSNIWCRVSASGLTFVAACDDEFAVQAATCERPRQDAVGVEPAWRRVVQVKARSRGSSTKSGHKIIRHVPPRCRRPMSCSRPLSLVAGVGRSSSSSFLNFLLAIPTLASRRGAGVRSEKRTQAQPFRATLPFLPEAPGSGPKTDTGSTVPGDITIPTALPVSVFRT
jgi:hypothetical protein